MFLLHFIIFLAILLIIIINTKLKKIFMFYFKISSCLIICVIIMIISIPVMMLRPGNLNNCQIAGFMIKHITKLLYDISFEVKGKENIINDVGTVVVMNHQSYLDTIGLCYLWPLFDELIMVVKSEAKSYPFFQVACWLTGVEFIDRKNKEKNRESINKLSTRITKNKAKICLFPEGTRHMGDKLLPFKKGAFHLAVDSQAPIQPIVISQYKFLDYDNYRCENGTPVIKILPAVSTVGLQKGDVNSLTEKVYNMMMEEYKRI